MKLWRRALISVDRNWKKSTLLFILFLIIVNVMLAATLVLRTTYQTREHFYRNMPNQIAIVDDSTEALGLPLESLNQIRELPYVRSSRYGVMSSLVSHSVIPFFSDNSGLESEHPCIDIGFCGFTFHGISNSQMTELDTHVFRLSGGRFFSLEEIDGLHKVAIISQSLADLNHLVVGDIIYFETILPNFGNVLEDVILGDRIAFQVVGIFQLDADISGNYANEIVTEANGMIFIPNQAAVYANEQAISLFRQHLTDEQLEELLNTFPSIRMMFNGGIPYAFFNLFDMRDYSDFYEQVRILLPENVTIGTLEHWGFDGMGRSLDQIKGILNYFLYGSIVACVSVVGLGLWMLLKERHYEVGIYLSLGVTKIGLILQFLFELFLVSIPVFMISIFTGNWLSSYLNHWLLTNFLATNIESYVVRRTLFMYTNTITDELVYEMHQVSLSIEMLFLTLLLFFLIITIFTVVPLAFLFKGSPNKLLSSGCIK